jgi:hypothetical protein
MGWTYTRKPNHLSVKDFLINHSGALTWSSPEREWDYKVLDSAIVKLKTFYAAVEMVHRKTGERRVWAAVFLLGYGRRSYDDHNFGWKDMSEDMGPCEAECPERILNLLTPTDSEYANEWRARCRANIAARKTPPPSIEKGDEITMYDKQYRVGRSLGRKGFVIERLSDGEIFRLPHAHLRDRVTAIKKKEQA